MELFRFTMLNFAVLFLFLQILPITILAKSKYTDETRPYEFGFNIEGQQHRKEKKDENGLIMGEFGFITADGVYHVTVYATDENGNFKILSMKNIRLGPAPDVTPPPLLVLTSTLPPVRPSFPNSLPSEQFASPSSPRPIVTAPTKSIVSCSHCSIPSTTQRPFNPPPNYNQQQNPSMNLEAPFQNNPSYQQNQGFQQDQPQVYPQNPSYSQNGQFPRGQNQQPYQNQLLDQQTGPSTQSPTYSNPSDNFDPILISAVMRPVDSSALVSRPLPGEQPGLPTGVTEQDMVGLLYRFNYTLGFHGHHEEGYTNGAKKGEYYVNNRNGLATKVSYVADNTGFHPKVSTVRLSEIETPKEETEKNDEFGLKGYEFTWFYVPKYHYLNQK